MALLLYIGIISIALAVSALIIVISAETDDEFLDLDDDFNYFEED